jgi:phosphoglycerol transferase
MHQTIIVFCLLLMVWLLLASSKWSWAKAGLLSLLLACLSSWWFIDRLSGDGINAATLYHLDAGMEGAGVADFSGDIAVFVLLLLASLLPLALPKVRRFRRERGGAAMTMGFVAALVVAVLASPLYSDGMRLYQQTRPADASAVASEYVVPAEPLSKRKNIVWIYGESLERTYLDQKAFPGLMPNIARLAGEGLDFRNVASAEGGGWTIGGMVSSFCGVPLTSSPGDENSFGRMGSFLPEARCLGDYLHGQGYRGEFVGGADGAFAGKASFLASHGYDDVRDLAFFRQRGVGASHFSDWGVHDDVMLDQAWDDFRKLSQAGQPFMLTALTMDTHHPAGHLPVSCKGTRYDSAYGDIGLLKALKCSDRLISELVAKIRSSPWADDTIVVVASDHLAMPNDLSDVLAGLERENLLLFLGKDIAPRQVRVAAGSTLDSGATLLQLMDPRMQALGFGRSLLSPDAGHSASAAATRDNGRDYPRYLAYARSLWTGGKTRVLRVDNDRIRVGVQEMRPPVLLDYDAHWNLKGIDLEDVPRRFRGASPENTLAYVDRCTAFDDDAPESGWCALMVNSASGARLYNSTELRQGVRVDAPLQQLPGMRQQLRQPVMLGAAIRDTKPGQYKVTLRTRQQPGHPYWIEVVSAQGELLAQHLVLPDSSGRIQMQVGLDREIDDMQIRAWLGSADEVMLDDVAMVRSRKSSRS